MALCPRGFLRAPNTIGSSPELQVGTPWSAKSGWQFVGLTDRQAAPTTTKIAQPFRFGVTKGKCCGASLIIGA
jgi:hypothetical protein